MTDGRKDSGRATTRAGANNEREHAMKSDTVAAAWAQGFEAGKQGEGWNPPQAYLVPRVDSPEAFAWSAGWQTAVDGEGGGASE